MSESLHGEFRDSTEYLEWFDRLNKNEQKKERKREEERGRESGSASNLKSCLSSPEQKDQLFVPSTPESLASEQLNVVVATSTPTSTPDYSKSFLFQFFGSKPVHQTDFVKRNLLGGANPKNDENLFNRIIAAIVQLIPNANDEESNKKHNYDELKGKFGDLHSSLKKMTNLKLLLGLLGYGFFKASSCGNVEASKMWHDLNLTSETCKDESDLDMVRTFLKHIETIALKENKDLKDDLVYTAIKEAYEKYQQQKTEQTQALERRSSVEQRGSISL